MKHFRNLSQSKGAHAMQAAATTAVAQLIQIIIKVFQNTLKKSHSVQVDEETPVVARYKVPDNNQLLMSFISTCLSKRETRRSPIVSQNSTTDQVRKKTPSVDSETKEIHLFI